MLAKDEGATSFNLSTLLQGYLSFTLRGLRRVWLRYVSVLLKRRSHMILLVGGAMVLGVLALVLGRLIISTDVLARRVRYTSICTRCGLQTAQDFYLLLGTELL